jgi:hypothetical protein
MNIDKTDMALVGVVILGIAILVFVVVFELLKFTAVLKYVFS